MNWELPDVKTLFRKGRGTRDQTANSHCILDKPREFQKNSYFCFINYTKAFDCVDYDKLWKILQEMGIPATLPASWEICMQVKKLKLEWDMKQWEWFCIGKGAHQGCILSPCLLNLYSEYLMWNSRLDEAQAEIKSAGKISITSDMQITPPLWQKVKRN